MKNEIDQLLLGIIVGSVLGGLLFYILLSDTKEKTRFLKKIKDVLHNIQDIDIEKTQAMLAEVLKHIPQKRKLANLLSLTILGINSWKKWR
ncbi:MAG TPA: hypothetical protein VLE95_08410 [Chlamydiales bacterium]|nr:hypothetical protein [Chlamydiales bacterium]